MLVCRVVRGKYIVGCERSSELQRCKQMECRAEPIPRRGGDVLQVDSVCAESVGATGSLSGRGMLWQTRGRGEAAVIARPPTAPGRIPAVGSHPVAAHGAGRPTNGRQPAHRGRAAQKKPGT